MLDVHGAKWINIERESRRGRERGSVFFSDRGTHRPPHRAHRAAETHRLLVSASCLSHGPASPPTLIAQ